ncbi:efflux RND transporter periplasmic adaptor subunit [Fimbriimonas ginsengisoli]|uniref:RND family efflux transporter MFP subunit n=1 Tax=Fimbriimonas ginsengisoli Gsoil 348 TaxID=661478 RepID=A0A068NN33_FIMGI|nr:efflux RND transporter periplasmic adaptor subunit [Fimbriimonas ginsengisoli]AIE84140.1 RND family efflux transporter MFP subunit [Fimbriimonas ginsengisoli Gsoil 348]
MTLKRILLIVIPVVLLGALIAWRFKVNAAKASQAGVGGAPAGGGQRGGGAGGGRSGGGGGGGGGGTVTLGVAGPRQIESTIDTVGSVDSPYNVKLSPKTAGLIDFLEVREGAAVKAGQVLVKIDPREIEGQVLQQQAAVAEARSRLAQAQLTQGSTNVGITSQIRQQRAGVSSAQADFGQVRQNYAAQIAAAQSTVTDANAKIDAAESQVANAKANVVSAQANLANAQTKYNRIYSLYKQGFAPAQDVDDARTTVDVQKAALAVASGQVDAANSALRSAQAVRNSAQNQVRVLRLKEQADVAASRARVATAQAGLDVAAANRSQGPAYAANIAALRSTVAAAVAQLRQAEARRADTVLKSPIDGVVTARTADPGAIASTGTPVLTIQFLKWVYVSTSVPVEQSRTVVVGTPATFTVDALPGKTFDAHVAEVNPAADPQSRQFLVRFKVDNAAQQLRPGMFARVHIVLSKVDAAVAVPREAVKQTPQGPTVFVVDAQNTAHAVPVKLGAEDSNGYQILEGVKAGDRVVTLSYSPVRDGQKVRTGGGGGSRGSGGGEGGQGRRRRGGGSQ